MGIVSGDTGHDKLVISSGIQWEVFCPAIDLGAGRASLVVSPIYAAAQCGSGTIH